MVDADTTFSPVSPASPVSPDGAAAIPAAPLTADGGRDMRLAYLLAGFAALVACNQVGSIIFPTLIKRSPSLLLLLSSRMRHLLFAVAADINPIAYAVVGFIRISAAAWICYGLGFYYGDRGVKWLERQVQGETPATFRWLQRAADRAGPVLTFFMPGSNVVCVLVGQRKMPKERFAIWLSAGITFRLIWLWIAARIFDSELKSILKFIDNYQWWLVAAFFGITIVQSAYKTAKSGPPPPRP